VRDACWRPCRASVCFVRDATRPRAPASLTGSERVVICFLVGVCVQLNVCVGQKNVPYWEVHIVAPNFIACIVFALIILNFLIAPRNRCVGESLSAFYLAC
jgi:hypothetical protein